jgi:hypothetical protein
MGMDEHLGDAAGRSSGCAGTRAAYRIIQTPYCHEYVPGCVSQVSFPQATGVRLVRGVTLKTHISLHSVVEQGTLGAAMKLRIANPQRVPELPPPPPPPPPPLMHVRGDSTTVDERISGHVWALAYIADGWKRGEH